MESTHAERHAGASRSISEASRTALKSASVVLGWGDRRSSLGARVLQITGVELTQAIQYFGSTFPVCGHLTSRRPCADNSIPLVEGRPTAVRIYFEGAAPPAAVTGFGVKLLQDGSPSTVTFSAVSDVVNVASPPAREDARQSVNLVIPAQASGRAWKLSVSIFEKLPTGVGQVAQKLVDLAFERRALVPLRLVRMHYKGRGMDVPPPTMADFWDMADFAQRTWPVPLPGFCIVRESIEVFDGAFSNQLDSDDPAEIGTTGTIWDILERLRASEGFPPDVVYFGFYPNPAGANGGAGGGRTFVAPNVIPELTTHELGHAYGLAHAPTPAFGPTFGGTDMDFPRYGTLPWGSTGEVGFDPRTLATIAPSTFDFMGYDVPRWVAPYQYLKLFSLVGAPRPGPCSILPFPSQVFRDPHIRQFSCVYVEDAPGGEFIKKLCGPKIPPEFPWPPKGGPPGPIRASLLDANGSTIFEETFELSSFSEPAFDPPRHLFTITLPELDGAERLVVTHGDRVIEDSELTRTPVAFEADARVTAEPNALVHVEWRLSRENAGAPVFVRASSDGGRTWTAFNVTRDASALDIDPGSLPPGDTCLVEVLAGEQLSTSSWTSPELPIRTGRDELLVLRPRGKPRVGYGELLELAAVTTYGAADEQLVWSSDRDGDLGVGGYQLVRLSPGQHALSVRRGATGKPIRGATVRVTGPPRRG
jgi:hypothetical protein